MRYNDNRFNMYCDVRTDATQTLDASNYKDTKSHRYSWIQKLTMGADPWRRSDIRTWPARTGVSQTAPVS